MNILVVRTDKIGDFVTALPSLYVLKHYQPNNRIIVLVSPMNKTLAQKLSFIDEVLVDEGESLMALSKKIKGANIKASITLFSNTRVALAQFLAGIKTRIAPATKIAQIFYTKRVVQRRSRVEMSEFEYNLQLCKVLFKDISLDFKRPLFVVCETKKEAVYSNFLKEQGISKNKKVIAFHPGFGGSSDANWTVSEYVELAQSLSENNSIQIVFTFGPGEENLRKEVEQLTQGDDFVVYTSKGSLVDFCELLASFCLFISTSTGTYHLAALVGTPTMTFFADNLFASSKRWKSVSDDKDQHNYMIPLEDKRRDAFFKVCQKELRNIVKTFN